MRLQLCLAAALCAASCVSIETTESAPPADAALTAIQNAHPHACAPDRAQANARSGADTQSSGVEGVDIAFTPLASDPTRALRLRRLTVRPGGVVAWHNHQEVQGMALLISGEMTEYRNDCLDPIVHHPGDVAREDGQTAHGWRNLSDKPAVFLLSHVVAAPH